MNDAFLFAGLASGATALVHVFLGGPEIARPLLAAKDIGRTAKLTNYYCWHLVSITLAAIAGCFGFAAVQPDAVELAALAVLLAGAFALWSIALALVSGHGLLKLPQWLMFAVIAATGAAGFV